MDRGQEETITALLSERARRWGPPRGSGPAEDVAINFDQGLPDPTLFPIDELRRCLDETLLEDGDQALRYFGTGGAHEMQYGHLGLRTELARRLSADEANHSTPPVSPSSTAPPTGSRWPPTPSSVRATAPSSRRPPTHTRRFMAATGATIATVPLDGDGMVVAELPRVLDELRAAGVAPKLIYTTPTFHSPTSTVLPTTDGAAWSTSPPRGVIVLEDDCYHDSRTTRRRRPPCGPYDTAAWCSNRTASASTSHRACAWRGSPARRPSTAWSGCDRTSP